jgi:hypothetical protein
LTTEKLPESALIIVGFAYNFHYYLLRVQRSVKVLDFSKDNGTLARLYPCGGSENCIEVKQSPAGIIGYRYVASNVHI